MKKLLRRIAKTAGTLVLLSWVAFCEGSGFRLGYFEAPMGMLPSDGYHSYDSDSKKWTFEPL